MAAAASADSLSSVREHEPAIVQDALPAVQVEPAPGNAVIAEQPVKSTSTSGWLRWVPSMNDIRSYLPSMDDLTSTETIGAAAGAFVVVAPIACWVLWPSTKKDPEQEAEPVAEQVEP